MGEKNGVRKVRNGPTSVTQQSFLYLSTVTSEGRGPMIKVTSSCEDEGLDKSHIGRAI